MWTLDIIVISLYRLIDMSTLLTEQESIDLAAEVEAQLRELREFEVAIQRTRDSSDRDAA
jgi:hypothetical protein